MAFVISTLPGMLFFAAVGFALSAYLWGYPVAAVLVADLAIFWYAMVKHLSQGAHNHLISQIRQSMDAKGDRKLDQTMASEFHFPDFWWPLVLTTLVAAVVTTRFGVLSGLAFLPILGYMTYRVHSRAALVELLEREAEQELAADVH